jgi:hypothetical protein
MRRGEGSFEAGPACCLCFITARPCVQDVDPGIFPFEIRPTTSPMLGRLENLPSLIGPTGREQAACDLGGDRWHLPDRLLVLRDECVDIPLSIRVPAEPIELC